MKVIWKRPDGFHGASPGDYEVVQVANNSKIWLHKQDNVNFPFRVSGGWQDEDATKKLNQLVNLLNKDEEAWLEHLTDGFFNFKSDSAAKYIEKIDLWLSDLRSNLKGDQWELTIMNEVLSEVLQKTQAYQQAFMARAQVKDP